MPEECLLSVNQKISNKNNHDFISLAQSMTADEVCAMRQELIKNLYPLSPDASPEQTTYEYILFLLYEAESCDRFTADTMKLYDILYSIE